MIEQQSEQKNGETQENRRLFIIESKLLLGALSHDCRLAARLELELVSTEVGVNV